MRGQCRSRRGRPSRILDADVERVWKLNEDPHYYTTLRISNLSTLHSHVDEDDFSIVSTIYNTSGRTIVPLTGYDDDEF